MVFYESIVMKKYSKIEKDNISLQIYFRGKRSKKYIIFKKSEVSNFFKKLEISYLDFRKEKDCSRIY